jgi:hypothetical protein
MVMLYTFHRVLVIAASLGALAFAAWCMWSLDHGGGSMVLAEAMAAMFIPIGAFFYLQALKRKVGTPPRS